MKYNTPFILYSAERGVTKGRLAREAFLAEAGRRKAQGVTASRIQIRACKSTGVRMKSAETTTLNTNKDIYYGLGQCLFWRFTRTLLFCNVTLQVLKCASHPVHFAFWFSQQLLHMDINVFGYAYCCHSVGMLIFSLFFHFLSYIVLLQLKVCHFIVRFYPFFSALRGLKSCPTNQTRGCNKRQVKIITEWEKVNHLGGGIQVSTLLWLCY